MAMSRDSTRWCEQRSRVRCNVTNRGSRRVYRPRRASHQPQERARLDGALQRQSCRCRQYQTRGRGPRSSRGFGVARPASARQAQRVRRSRRPAACRSGVLLVPSSLARQPCARHRRHRDGASRPTLVEQIRRSNTCSNCTPVVNFCLPNLKRWVLGCMQRVASLSLRERERDLMFLERDRERERPLSRTLSDRKRDR